MEKEILEEQARFLDFIKNYEYINEKGFLDLEAFCVYLSACFNCDGILGQSPQPRDVYNLLIDILSSKSADDEISLWVQRQNLIDWSPEVAGFYPDGYRTYVHIAGLIHGAYEWIYEIGHNLMSIPEPESPSKYFDWVSPEWVFVYAYINGFHNSFSDFQKKIDRESASERGFSLFEALHKSTSSGSSYEQAAEEIVKRNSAYNETIKRIEKSIKSGFNLEAITLQECLISNCLFNYLKAVGVDASGLSFYKLIMKCKARSKSSEGLFDQIDQWRAKRNNAIHGFVESSVQSFSDSQGRFDLFSTETSLEGESLCRSVCDWYLREAVNFIPTEFPEEDRKLN